MRWVFFLCLCLMVAASPPEAVAGGLALSELFPNPSGNEAELEWIEIVNLGAETVDLSGWSIRDTHGAITTFFFPSIEISPGSYYLIWRPTSKIVLNNDKDGLELIDPTGEIVSSTEYLSSREDQSWCLPNEADEWGWCAPTPGQQNESTMQPSPSPNTQPSPTPSPTPEPSQTAKPVLPNSQISLSEISACGPENEWVELLVTNGEGFHTEGFHLRDLGGAVRTLASSYTSGLHLVTWTSPILNNTGDTLFLFSSEDELIEQVELPRCVSGTSYAKSGSRWVTTEYPTPGSANDPSVAQVHQASESGVVLKLGDGGDPDQTKITEKRTLKLPGMIRSEHSFLPQDSQRSARGRTWAGFSPLVKYKQATVARLLFYSSLLLVGSQYSRFVATISDLVQ